MLSFILQEMSGASPEETEANSAISLTCKAFPTFQGRDLKLTVLLLPVLRDPSQLCPVGREHREAFVPLAHGSAAL